LVKYAPLITYYTENRGFPPYLTKQVIAAASLVLFTFMPAKADTLVNLKVKAIEITGNKRTKGRVILAEMTFKTGDVISKQDLELSRQGIMNLELFSYVSLNVVETEQEGEIMVAVNVKEKWSILPLPIAGRNSDGDVKLGVQYEDFNIGGRAHYLNFKYYKKWANDAEDNLGSHYSARWAAKNYPKNGLTLEPSFKKGSELEESYESGEIVSKYKVNSENYSIGISKDYGGHSLGLAYSYGNNDYKHMEGTEKIHEDTKTRSIGISGSVGIINNLGHYLYDGCRLDLAVAYSHWAMGSSTNSVTYSAGFSRFIPVNGKNIAYRLLAAYGSGGGKRGVLIGTGGSTSIRGYEKGEFEGNRMVQLNSEYRFPITEKYWGGVLFLDGGNAWKKGDSLNIGDINWSAGLGLRLFIKKLVKGVGRMDIAYNVERQEYKAYLGVHHTF